MMKGEDLLLTIYKLNKELQPLLALLAEDFSTKHGNINVDSSREFAQRLKTCFNSKIEKTFKNTNNDTAKKIFKNSDKNKRKKGELKDAINPKELDSYILLRIMLETEYFPERKEAKCKQCHNTKCCSSCDGHEKNKCVNCDIVKKDCGKICCDVCDMCVRCSTFFYGDFSDSYFIGSKGKFVKLSEIPKWKLCCGINILSSLDVLLKCRNLFHLTKIDCENFLQQKVMDLGDFKKLQNLDHFVKTIHLAIKTIIHVLKKSSQKDTVEEVEDIECKMDKIINDDSQILTCFEESEGIALVNQLLTEFSLTEEERKLIQQCLKTLQDHEKRILRLEKELQLGT